MKNKWLELKNHFAIYIVFEISVFEISKFNLYLTDVALKVEHQGTLKKDREIKP